MRTDVKVAAISFGVLLGACSDTPPGTGDRTVGRLKAGSRGRCGPCRRPDHRAALVRTHAVRVRPRALAHCQDADAETGCDQAPHQAGAASRGGQHAGLGRGRGSDRRVERSDGAGAGPGARRRPRDGADRDRAAARGAGAPASAPAAGRGDDGRSVGQGGIGERRSGGGLGGVLAGIIGAVVIRGGHGGIDNCDPRIDGRRTGPHGRPGRHGRRTGRAARRPAASHGTSDLPDAPLRRPVWTPIRVRGHNPRTLSLLVRR